MGANIPIKKIIFAFVLILVIIVVAILILTNSIKKQQNITGKTPEETNQLITPTGKIVSEKKDQVEDLRKALPFVSEDLEINYSSLTNKFIVIKKSPQGEEKLQSWAKLNNANTLMKENPNLFITSSSFPITTTPITPTIPVSITPGGPTPTSNVGLGIVVDLLTILKNLSNSLIINSSTGSGGLIIPPTITPTPFISPTIIALSPTAPALNLVHYRQKDGLYDYYPLDGVNCYLKDAGCGPTTVAMILSSKIDSGYTPPKVVDLYKESGYFINCLNGSSYVHAQLLLNQLGVKTTNLIFAKNTTVPIGEVADEMRLYIKNGWTLFTLASFMTSQGEMGHYFWILDVDENNNVWAYDGYYGRFQIPFNENVYYPYPKYKLAFGVK